MKTLLLAASALSLLAADATMAQTVVRHAPNGDTKVVTHRPNGSTVVRRYRYGGRYYNAVRAPRWVAPRGWAYRRYGIGAYLPNYFLGSSYYVNPVTFGLRVRPAGANRHWIRVGDDLYLVNNRGRVIQVVPNVFYY
jgi:Ni/Co efflux regulator RcnB